MTWQKTSHGLTKSKDGITTRLQSLGDQVFRVAITDSGEHGANYKVDRTWTIPNKEGYPLEGKHRDDFSAFKENQFTFENGEFKSEQVTVTETDGLFTWRYQDKVFAQDNVQGYVINSDTKKHYLNRSRDEFYWGLGEKSGLTNKHGQRYRMKNCDPMGYSAKHSDPLYKHWPFYITYSPATGVAYGLFYDNFSDCVFDLGCEAHNYFGDYRYFESAGGDLDYYMIVGPSVREVVDKWTRLIGRSCVPPEWALGYMGSTMGYTEADRSQERIEEFAKRCENDALGCTAFHLSSGYTKRGERRYVFTWNEEKFPRPEAHFEKLRAQGIQTIANVKPVLLDDHPMRDEASEFLLEQPAPFWDGKGQFVDFSNPWAIKWWQSKLKSTLLDRGVSAIWNDNNEYFSFKNDTCNGFGREIPLDEVRPLMSLWMTRASAEIASGGANHSNDKQAEYVLTRSGCPGIQRYAQTWSGDNFTSWESLKYSIPMSLGLGLSGLANFGHDIGGFSGPKPDSELFLRWIQFGIFLPRFCIHSWNEDDSVNEPWMHEEIYPEVRELMNMRKEMVPQLKALLEEAAKTGAPVLRPLFFEFPEDPECYAQDFQFMWGAETLVAPVLDAGVTKHSVYLPSGASWKSAQTSEIFAGGQTIEVDSMGTHQFHIVPS